MRLLQVHIKARPRVNFGPAFCPWPTDSVYVSYFGHCGLGLSLKDRSKSICQFTFNFNPVCKICSWNLFGVTKNDLKKCVSEFAALLQSQREVRSVLLKQSTPSQILCACTLRDLRLSLCWNHLHSFFPCFSLLGNFTKVRSPSDTVSWYRSDRPRYFGIMLVDFCPLDASRWISLKPPLLWLGST